MVSEYRRSNLIKFIKSRVVEYRGTEKYDFVVDIVDYMADLVLWPGNA